MKRSNVFILFILTVFMFSCNKETEDIDQILPQQEQEVDLEMRQAFDQLQESLPVAERHTRECGFIVTSRKDLGDGLCYFEITSQYFNFLTHGLTNLTSNSTALIEETPTGWYIVMSGSAEFTLNIINLNNFEWSEACSTTLSCETCFDINVLEEQEGNCCLYSVCSDITVSGHNSILLTNGDEVILDSETNCAEVVICGNSEVTIIDNFTDGGTFEGCTKEVTCHDREACCESICFDFEVLGQGTLCTTFSVSFGGDEVCFPDGLVLALQSFGGNIIFNEINSPQGTVELVESNSTSWLFTFCAEDLFVENEIELTIFEFFCEMEQTFNFDLRQPEQQYHDQCKD